MKIVNTIIKTGVLLIAIAQMHLMAMDSIDSMNTPFTITIGASKTSDLCTQAEIDQALLGSTFSSSSLVPMPLTLPITPTYAYNVADKWSSPSSSKIEQESYNKIKKQKRPYKKAEKRIPCSYKDCTFKAQDTTKLARHIRSHTGLQPYICSVEGCERRFSDISNMKRHYKKMHAEKDANKSSSSSSTGITVA